MAGFATEAASQLVKDESEVSGFAGGVMGDEPAMIRGVWTDMRPSGKSWTFPGPGPARGGSFWESIPADL